MARYHVHVREAEERKWSLLSNSELSPPREHGQRFYALRSLRNPLSCPQSVQKPRFGSLEGAQLETVVELAPN